VAGLASSKFQLSGRVSYFVALVYTPPGSTFKFSARRTWQLNILSVRAQASVATPPGGVSGLTSSTYQLSGASHLAALADTLAGRTRPGLAGFVREKKGISIWATRRGSWLNRFGVRNCKYTAASNEY
jgi:hypothetical protein